MIIYKSCPDGACIRYAHVRGNGSTSVTDKGLVSIQLNVDCQTNLYSDDAVMAVANGKFYYLCHYLYIHDVKTKQTHGPCTIEGNPFSLSLTLAIAAQTSSIQNSLSCKTQVRNTSIIDLYAAQGPNGCVTADLEPKVPRDALRPAQLDMQPQACDDACRRDKSDRSLIIGAVVAVVVGFVFGVVIGAQWWKRKKRTKGSVLLIGK
ncbi:hypothetical protein BG000_009177 [Podila horticola]|nr:hypothetical protein BG000_009177 [Podila horticola]